MRDWLVGFALIWSAMVVLIGIVYAVGVVQW